jgi:DNA-binding PadR family transcriptional regulator
MLELAILGLLKDRPMHGYQLSRELTEQLGGFWRVSYGSLYPTLRRLERQEAVEPNAGPEAPTAGRRRRTTYRITEEGERLFLQLLQETPHDTQSEEARFRVRLAFFRYLPPETRLRLLERRRASLEDRLSSISASLATASGRADAYALSLMQHGRDATEQDLAWIDGLIEAERDRATTLRGGAERRRASLRRKERTSS